MDVTLKNTIRVGGSGYVRLEAEATVGEKTSHAYTNPIWFEGK
jgi:hypothetical protein